MTRQLNSGPLPSSPRPEQGPLSPQSQEAAARETSIALVFTDVVGSSAAKRAAELGNDVSTRDRAYLASIQSAHLRLVRDVTARYAGREIMTIGDSFFLEFANASDAIKASAAIQDELRESPVSTWNGRLRLRIGIHVGCPEHFENSWHGTDVDIAARAQAAASADQIVITETALPGATGSAEFVARPLGTFALRGVGNVKLWDVDYAGFGLRRPQLLSNEQRRLRRRATAASVLTTTLALLILGLWQWHLRNQAAVLAAAAKSSILLQDFDNKTGDPVFDGMLTSGLTSQLEQSPILRLVSQYRLSQDAGYLGKPKGAILNADDFRNLSIREGIKASLSGSISKIGSSYVITVNARSVSSGDEIATEEVHASSKEQVMNAISRLAGKMRRRLGESLDSIQKLDMPLEQATTPSLEAFRAFSLGDAEHERGNDEPAARGYYSRAVQIDPEFALAWARLGTVEFNNDRFKEANDDLSRAYKLSARTSEEERFYILGRYYMDVLGDLQKTISTLEIATRVYPRNPHFHVNLGIAYGSYGEMPQYLEQFQKTVELDPHSASGWFDLFGVQLSLDRVSDAEKTLGAIRRAGFHSDSTYFLREQLLLYFLKGDRDAMRRVLGITAGRLDQFQIIGSLALLDEFEGRYGQAAAAWQHAHDQVKLLKVPDMEALFLLRAATGSAMIGRCATAVTQIHSALELDRGKSTLDQAALPAAVCGDKPTLTAILSQLVNSFPDDTIVNQITIPQSKAAQAISSHAPSEALRYLASSERFDLISPSAYLRGLAYLDLKDGGNAMAAFRSAIRYRGAAVICCQDYPLAELGLARAYSMVHDSSNAIRTYKELINSWKDADPSLPQLIAAKRELAALSQVQN